MRHSITSSTLYSALDLFLETDEEILSDPEHVNALSDDIETSLPTRPVAAGQWWGVSKTPSTNDLLARLATFRGQASESFLSLAPKYYGEIQQLSINEENNFYFKANSQQLSGSCSKCDFDSQISRRPPCHDHEGTPVA
jgi:uncharacterized protein (AIM24 family)